MRIKVFAYANDGNTAILKTISEVEHLENTNLYYKLIRSDDYFGDYYSLYVPLDIDKNMFFCCEKRMGRSFDEVKKFYYDHEKIWNKDGVINTITECVEYGYYTGRLEILLCNTLGFTELAKKCVINRQKIIDIRKKEQAEREAEAERLEQEKQKKEELEKEQKIATATDKFCKGLDISGKDFELLCKKYDVELNIRFLGWLREHCGSIVFKNIENYGYRCRPGHKSTTAHNYILKLVTKLGIA